MHFCARIHDHGQMIGLITCCEHGNFLTNQWTWRASRVSLLGQSQEIYLETRHLSKSQREQPPFSEFALLLFTWAGRRQDGAVSDDDESGGDVNRACAEAVSEHDRGFLIFPHFLHWCLSLFVFLLLPSLPLGFESDHLCENLHLSPRAQVPLA